MLSAKLGPRVVKVPFDADATIAALRLSLADALELPPDASFRVLYKGKAITANAATTTEVGLKAGVTVMLMHTKASEIEAVQAAKPERMRGFEEGDRRQATGGLGRSGGGAVPTSSRGSAASQYRFHALQPLTVLPAGAKPATSACMARLRELSSDPAVLKILEEHKWTVGKLSEMPPEGLVGVSASCLMGLNRNRGEEILLRLRTDDWAGLRAYSYVIDVLMHELAHCVYGDHDADFKALWALLKMEYAQHRARLGSGRSTGASDVYQPTTDVGAEQAVGHVLGGSGGGAPDVSPAAAAAAAAAARLGLTRAEGCKQSANREGGRSHQGEQQHAPPPLTTAADAEAAVCDDCMEE